MDQDAEHLRLLSIFHYVVAGLGALFACFPIFHLGFGLLILFAPDSFWNDSQGVHHAQNPPRFVGAILTAVASLVILTGWAMSFCVFLAGRYLTQRRRYTFCLVIAAIMCIMVPFGTVLGVFTIIVLMRPSVKALFESQTALPPA
jgi:hypothetical protein